MQDVFGILSSPTAVPMDEEDKEKNKEGGSKKKQRQVGDEPPATKQEMMTQSYRNTSATEKTKSFA